ncbi:hypothetical protein P3X46_005991 [Hevea brasiliensis]|uniref:CW-type domain-containing protein n=1 Tax=Hevea brasiliensis TaxID=3981 RepID=A0ABQ9MRE0_HEVBR|nr:cysteine-tryptophan domain-containing zinc finger protein 5 isoform X1 [Hevea brasiliensis]KAJ9181948.1 hypothetical protein P3X46_005991 [Hevea brasiliensis]
MGGMEMENSELEEGEAFQYKDDDDSIDPEIALSYIDEKIQNVLGHFQKDFEGGVSAENLGAKFGGYGSFLPTYERSPQRNSACSHPKTPQNNSSPPRSPNSFPVEGAPQSLRVPSNALPSVKLGTASYSANALHKSRLASGDFSVKQDSSVSSARFSWESNLKDGNSNKTGNLSDQRTLKVRIKVGPDSVARKNAAIYSGLGLDNSPSSSLGNSPEESDGMLPVVQQIADESPTSILQTMISFPVPGVALISPLHESLLCLIRKEKLSRDSKLALSLKGSQDNFALLADESISFMGNGKLLKGNEVEFLGKSERAVDMKCGNGIIFENSTAFSDKKKLENDNADNKDVLSSDLKSMPLPVTANGGEILKATGWSSEVPREADQGRIRNKLFSSDFMKEDSLESRSGQDSGKSEKRNAQNSSVEKVLEHKALSCDGNGKSKKSKLSAFSKGYFDASKCEEDLKVGSLASSKQKIDQQDEFSVPGGKERQLLEGKKSCGTESSKKSAAVPSKESLGIGDSGAPKDTASATCGVSKSKVKMHKWKLQKDISKVRDNHRDPLDLKSEQKNSQMGLSERPYASRQKESTMEDLEMEQHASFDKSRERFNGKRVGDQLMPGELVKDVAYVGSSIPENALASEVAPPVTGPILIEENWVCCDSCQKWRLLPYGIKPHQLPEKWLCTMLNWLPGKNRCDISEEETTKALNSLFQLPYAAGQNNLQNHASGTTSRVHNPHVDRNHQSFDSHAALFPGKKKRGMKEMGKAGSSSGMIQSSNSTKNQYNLQESVKSRSLNDMNQSPAEANQMNKSTFHALNTSHNLVAEQKENHIDGAGDTKQIKMKNKRETDLYEYETSEKTKTENASHTDKYHNSDMDLGRMGLNSKSGLSTKASGKEVWKSNEHFSGDLKFDRKEKLLVSMKKLGDRTQMSSDGGSLNMGTSDKINISMKKRKLREWQDNQNGANSSLSAKEKGECVGLKKEKKSRVSKSGASSMNNCNDKLDRKEKVGPVLSVGSQDHLNDGMEAVKSIHKDEQTRKHRRNFASQITLDVVDSSKKDCGPGQLPMTATSSSSKVSGSLKTRATFDDAKGSPVESVSSSPLRASFGEKLGSTGGNILAKDNATNDGLPVIDGLRRCRDGEGDGQINQSGKAKKEKVSGDHHPESCKPFLLDYQDGDASHKIGQTKCSSDLLNGGVEITGRRECSSGLLAIKYCHDEDREDKNQHDNVLFPQKFGKGSSVLLKDNDRSSTSDFDRDEMKVSKPVNAHGDFSKKSIRNESEIDPRSRASLLKRMNNVKHGIPSKPSSKSNKDEKVRVSLSDSIGQCSKDGRMENPSKLGERADSDAKLSAVRIRKWNTATPENLIQDFDGETKLDPMQRDSRSGTKKLAAHSGQEAKHESSHQSAPTSQQEGASVRRWCYVSGNDDVSKVSKNLENPGTNNGARQSLGHCMLDMKGARDLNASSTGRTNSSSQTASNALKEAKKMRDYADRLKISGFGFESNETNFQAALMFLHGASLLETCNDAGRQGEVTQIQMYSTTAKLCECCALEYERRHEMAAASLAYKCMEIAYWRVVNCKNSSLCRNELQACLQTFSQGESPSSSASDIDNLNNQATVDKAMISKGTISHVAGNPVIGARNHSNFLRLLDFTQDVNFAMEASRKSQNTYSAANVALEQVQNRECIISVKRVIDFSFQDVEGLILLVQHAMEAITQAGLVGARD